MNKLVTLFRYICKQYPFSLLFTPDWPKSGGGVKQCHSDKLLYIGCEDAGCGERFRLLEKSPEDSPAPRNQRPGIHNVTCMIHIECENRHEGLKHFCGWVIISVTVQASSLQQHNQIVFSERSDQSFHSAYTVINEMQEKDTWIISRNSLCVCSSISMLLECRFI